MSVKFYAGSFNQEENTFIDGGVLEQITLVIDQDGNLGKIVSEDNNVFEIETICPLGNKVNDVEIRIGQNEEAVGDLQDRCFIIEEQINT